MHFKNLKTALPTRRGQSYSGIYEMCSCENGRLFLSPPEKHCQADELVCQWKLELFFCTACVCQDKLKRKKYFKILYSEICLQRHSWRQIALDVGRSQLHAWSIWDGYNFRFMIYLKEKQIPITDCLVIFNGSFLIKWQTFHMHLKYKISDQSFIYVYS